ncbi:unnamed protein product [Rotaria sp. Silwood2]|nr:unnamed protein product [Rotaria sp. Silwood2]
MNQYKIDTNTNSNNKMFDEKLICFIFVVNTDHDNIHQANIGVDIQNLSKYYRNKIATKKMLEDLGLENK